MMQKYTAQLSLHITAIQNIKCHVLNFRLIWSEIDILNIKYNNFNVFPAIYCVLA